MSDAFLKCVHCGFPHRDDLSVCPRTNRRIERRHVGNATVAPAKKRMPQTMLSAGTPGGVSAARHQTVQVADATGWDDLVGKIVGGRYLVTGAIGRGGMGTVFEGEHIELGRPIAVKVLSPEQAKKRNATQRFQVEARTAGAIGHPNICEVYDMGMLPDGCPYLVMERLSGNTLQAKLSLEKRLSIPDAIDIVRGVLQGLAAAHEKNVVHRDIKPENIFLCTDPVPEVKLVDFGVAKVYGDDSDDSELNLTRTGMVMGTPYYMSAEQARGQRNLDARVDVYAAGVVLYECLAGVRPYIAPNYNALLVKIIGQDAPPLSGFRPDISVELERVVAKAMARSRKQRFQSAEDFIAALKEVDRKVPRAPASEPFPSVDVDLDVDLEESGMVAASSSWDQGEDTVASGRAPLDIPDAPISIGSLEDMPTIVMPGSGRTPSRRG